MVPSAGMVSPDAQSLAWHDRVVVDHWPVLRQVSVMSVLPLKVASVVKPAAQVNLASAWKTPVVVVEEALVMEGTAPHDLREHDPVQAPLANESAPCQPSSHSQLGAFLALAGHATF
jgi:hypothetical protein